MTSAQLRGKANRPTARLAGSGMILALQYRQVTNECKDVLKVDLHLHSSEDPEDVISHNAQTLVDRPPSSASMRSP